MLMLGGMMMPKFGEAVMMPMVKDSGTCF